MINDPRNNTLSPNKVPTMPQVENIRVRLAMYVWSIVIVVLAAQAVPAQQVEHQEASPALDLRELIREALENNPELTALRARLEALEHRVEPAGTLPDPMVGFALMNYPIGPNPLDIGRVPMTQTQFSYAQKFPYPGTLRLRKEVAGWDVTIGSEEIGEREVVIAALVRKAYLQLYLVNRNLEIVNRNKDLLQEFVIIAQSKYEVGKGLLQDVLKARVSLTELLATIEELMQLIETVKARINVLLNRNPNSPLGDPEAVTASAVEYDFDEAMAEADRQRPVLRALGAGIEKSETAVELALKRLNPDFTLRFAYGFRYEGTDFWNAGIAFNLPLWRGTKQREQVAEREAQRRVAQAKLLARRNEIGFAVRKALDETARTDEQMLLYNEAIIPQAEMSLESAVSGYQVDKVDFLTLLDNQLTLFHIELAYERIRVEHEMSVVDLDKAIGNVPVMRRGGY